VRVGEARGPGPLVDRHSDAIDLPAQGRMRSRVAHDLARPRRPVRVRTGRWHRGRCRRRGRQRSSRPPPARRCRVAARVRTCRARRPCRRCRGHRRARRMRVRWAGRACARRSRRQRLRPATPQSGGLRCDRDRSRRVPTIPRRDRMISLVRSSVRSPVGRAASQHAEQVVLEHPGDRGPGGLAGRGRTVGVLNHGSTRIDTDRERRRPGRVRAGRPLGAAPAKSDRNGADRGTRADPTRSAGSHSLRPPFRVPSAFSRPPSCARP
jgi:hypothetical protein